MSKEVKAVTEEDIANRIIVLKKLAPLKLKSDTELREIAISGLNRKRDKLLAKQNEKAIVTAGNNSQSTVKTKPVDIDITILFSNKEEKERATKLLDKYLTDYTIESISEKNTLRELIYLEIVQFRLQEKLNEYYEKDSKAVPLQVIDVIHKNSDAILKLKESLGLSKDKNKKSSYDVFQHLLKRAKLWRDENQASRTIVCPHCGKMTLLKIRTDIWEAQKHPFFKDKILYNRHLFNLLHQNKITKDDIAKVLECSADYIDWLLDKVDRYEK